MAKAKRLKILRRDFKFFCVHGGFREPYKVRFNPVSHSWMSDAAVGCTGTTRLTTRRASLATEYGRRRRGSGASGRQLPARDDPSAVRPLAPVSSPSPPVDPSKLPNPKRQTHPHAQALGHSMGSGTRTARSGASRSLTRQECVKDATSLTEREPATLTLTQAGHGSGGDTAAAGRGVQAGGDEVHLDGAAWARRTVCQDHGGGEEDGPLPLWPPAAGARCAVHPRDGRCVSPQ
jgi:hypothetical protein